MSLSAPVHAAADGDESSKTSQTGSPSADFSPTPNTSPSLAPVEVRLANAREVKVLTSVLSLELGDSLDSAHAKLDKLCDPAHPATEEKEEGDKDRDEGERKVLWRLAETDYSALFVKTDGRERITSITALLRPGKEQPFEQIGETSKAPVSSSSQVAWDVLRPDRPLIRVVATGVDAKANTILLFVVKRPGHDKDDME